MTNQLYSRCSDPYHLATTTMPTYIQLASEDSEDAGPLLPVRAGAHKVAPNRVKPFLAPVACVLAGILIGQLFAPYTYSLIHPSSIAASTAPVAASTPAHDFSDVLASNHELPEAVANNLRLLRNECDIGFPLLWGEVENTRRHFTGSSGITLDDLQAVEVFNGTRVRRWRVVHLLVLYETSLCNR